ncbi:MAG: Tetratricopeptide repeat protein [Methanobacterium sp. PtaB.Bin024]|nr:MAG: Tetratricopeptide repeat protein [Methanobacterium sp. PtaB.Bin024]
MKINPNDTTTLNNKGVQLVRQTKYTEAIKCFDKVLEIEPEDAVVSHNRNLVKEKLEIHKFLRLPEGIPKNRIHRKKREKILEIKEK